VVYTGIISTKITSQEKLSGLVELSDFDNYFYPEKEDYRPR